MSYAVANIVSVRAVMPGDERGEKRVVAWPHVEAGKKVGLIAGPFETLAEARQEARRLLIPAKWQGYDMTLRGVGPDVVGHAFDVWLEGNAA